MKICSKCNISKEINDFYEIKNFKRRGSCKECDKKYRRQRLERANPDQRRSVVLKNKYGITLNDYNKMLDLQQNKCKICRSTDPGPKGVFAVDHCHTTGKVRGLLCYLCNMGLGSFTDDISKLKNAIKYLEEL